MHNNAHDAIILINNDGKIEFWNAAAENMFGYKYIEVYNQDLHNLLAPQRYHEAYHKGFIKFKYSGKGYAINRTLELKGLHKEGHEIDVGLSLSSLKINDSWHSLGILRDISKLKETDELITNKVNPV